MIPSARCTPPEPTVSSDVESPTWVTSHQAGLPGLAVRRCRLEVVSGPDAGLVTLAEVEQRQILYTLDKTANNKSQAARILGISRQTLREKLKQYGGPHDDLSEEAES